ncbi:hypothetical protein FACS1894113_3280 [Alphaproteobacteria bacterium]|nr:hypothetical protein FACS1894113_3280 [Alphaproteobacteria bacterium]
MFIKAVSSPFFCLSLECGNVWDLELPYGFLFKRLVSFCHANVAVVSFAIDVKMGASGRLIAARMLDIFTNLLFGSPYKPLKFKKLSENQKLVVYFVCDWAKPFEYSIRLLFVVNEARKHFVSIR